MIEWGKYLSQLQAQSASEAGKQFTGEELTAEQLEVMNQDQREQLMELRAAAYDPKPTEAF